MSGGEYENGKEKVKIGMRLFSKFNVLFIKSHPMIRYSVTGAGPDKALEALAGFFCLLCSPHSILSYI